MTFCFLLLKRFTHLLLISSYKIRARYTAELYPLECTEQQIPRGLNTFKPMVMKAEVPMELVILYEKNANQCDSNRGVARCHR